MNATPKELPFDPGLFHGLSEKLLRSHHQNNYGGAVKRLSAIRAELQQARPGGMPGFELNGLKREELIATNSMLLHELYFDCLTPEPPAMTPAMALALAGSFGSVERWREEFAAVGKALGGGSGWVLLTFQPREGTLVNQWSADHTTRWRAACPSWRWTCTSMPTTSTTARQPVPMSTPSWPTSTGPRSTSAINGPCMQPARALRQTLPGWTWWRVWWSRAARRLFEQAATMLPGARWRDPATVQDWAAEPTDREVLVYCIYGHEVGRATALKLRALGINGFLPGGIDAWTAAGKPIQTKEQRA
jgi:Fe-Mn family superoxide dismutase